MIHIRDLRASETDLLATAALGNLNWSGPRFTAEQVRDTPGFAHYWTPPPGPGDLGVVAEAAAGDPVGVAWLRHFPDSDPGYGFVEASMPELSVWVRADHRGRGIGGTLLDSLIGRARDADLPGVSLSVEAGNPARAWYERLGFVPAGRPHDAGTLLLRF